ncbi:MAG TPA: amidase [Candidatus Saccharimonadales bacterium]|nr:amidase [Candidatus Saccharimonadales bacterium]
MRTSARRSLVLATVLALLVGVTGTAAPSVLAAKPTNTRVAGIDIDATTIPQLQSLMDRHRLKAVQLVQFYLHRISRLDPKLNAVITVSPTALADARKADAARRRGDRRPLLGIPVIVKDNVNTTGMPTTAGSWALAGSTPSDAFIVQQLKAAGAIIIAKANLSEWANFRSGPSSSGWSGIGGQTNMAYVLDRNPCGSSSGTAVAVSADLATVGVGTETDGSIVCPAGANGIVGIKPTIGLWSRAGIIPISADQDTAGPMARNVTDAAVLLGAGVGVDPDDAATAEQAGHALTDYTPFLDADALDGARIGVWHSYDAAGDPATIEIFEATVDKLESLGATVVDPLEIDFGDGFAREFDALLCEFKTDIASYLDTYTDAGYPKTLQDLIDFNNDHPELEGPWNNLVFDLAQETGGRADPDCAAARAATTPVIQAAIDDVLAAHDLDAIVAPTNNPAWVTDPVNGDSFDGFISSSGAAAVSGYAGITVANGFVGPLPVGVSFIGGRWSEPTLIGLAFAFEQATHVRVPPTFLATSDFDAASSERGRANQGERRLPVPGRGRSMAPLR